MDPCKFEPQIIVALDSIPKIESKLDTLTDLIKGVNDTKPGLIHKILSNSTAISRLWKFTVPIAILLISGSIKVMFF